ncbi:hypothetical protein C0J52_26557 [Blattella germanica]|nr:hypothetical protein C0J52_26557 [Blattella germanica]
MMPLAPTPIVAVPSKPKIGFSIDSIVGGGTNASCNISTNSSTTTASTTTPTTPPKHRPATSHSPECDVINTDTSPNPPSVSPASSTASNHYSTDHNNIENNRTTSHSPAGSSSPELSPGNYHRVRHHSGSISPSISHTSSPPPTGVIVQGTGLGSSANSGLSSNPTLVRPSALAPSNAGIVGSPGFTPSSGDAGLKGLYLPEPLVHPGHHHHSHHHPHHHHQLALAAAAAAQHFQAAGLAAALAQQSAAGGHHGAGFLPGGAGAPPGTGAPTHLPPHHPTPHPIPRDTYPLYPWLLSRHGRIFPHRFPADLQTNDKVLVESQRLL